MPVFQMRVPAKALVGENLVFGKREVYVLQRWALGVKEKLNT